MSLRSPVRTLVAKIACGVFISTITLAPARAQLQSDAQQIAYTPAPTDVFAKPKVRRSLPKPRPERMAGASMKAGVPQTAPPQQKPTTPPPAIQNLTPPYLSGEAKVKVEGNQNPLIRLGMAQNGVTMIEFPAADRFFAIHSGNSELVTVEKSPTMSTDHYLVLRAGSGFLTPSPPQPKMVKTKDGRWVASKQTVMRQELPATSIIVQMRSGMVMTLMIYPVTQLSGAAHRCVISYNKAEVVAARQAAGLAVNLKEDEQPLQPQPTATVVKTAESAAAQLQLPPPTASATTSAPVKVNEASSPALPAAAKDAAVVEIVAAKYEVSKYGAPSPERQVIVEIAHQAKRPVLTGVMIDAESGARAGLLEALKEPKRFKRWTSPVHGLSVSTLLARDISDRLRIIVIGVKNTFSQPLRLLPGSPELFIETLDRKGKPVQVERLRPLHIESTTANSVLPAGASVFYAVVFEPPILGAQQHLRLAVGQTNAADEPAAADLCKSTLKYLARPINLNIYARGVENTHARNS